MNESIQGMPEWQRERYERLTSGAVVAVTDRATDVSDDVRYFANVARKVLQRGRNPVIGVLEPSDIDAPEADALFAAAVGRVESHSRGFDSSIKLDPTYEHPFAQHVDEVFPTLSRFFFPQAPLEALIQEPDGSQRWVDFLLAPPWMPSPVVIELDGAQHTSALSVDKARDDALRKAGLNVSRWAGPEALSVETRLGSALRETAAMRQPAPAEDLIRMVHEPGAFTRLAFALVELLDHGQLSPGGEWDIDLVDETGWGQGLLGKVLDLLLGIDLVWDLQVRPSQVRTADECWSLTDAGYRKTPGAFASRARVRVVLEPFVPPHAPLPRVEMATVVVRGAYVPANLEWASQSDPERRNIHQDNPSVEAGLRMVLRHLFGYEDYRPGQIDAIKAALAGSDTCVLLPTGAGKSLIYQIAGLLRPGVTLVIDPLVSLVDDQEHRLRADGIDRVIGLHSGKVANEADRDNAYQEVASGDSLIVFLTPERLQVQSFRDALAQAAEEQMVNLAVIDEAHCVSEWGHDFRTAYLRVGRNVRWLSRRWDDVDPPLLALTGTASPAVLRDLQNELAWGERPFEVLRPETFDRPNLSYELLVGPQETWSERLRLALTEAIPHALRVEASTLVEDRGDQSLSGLVFVPHTNGKYGIQDVSRDVSTILKPAGPKVRIYAGAAPKHWPGGKVAWAREKSRYAEDFKANRANILVSTKAFGMGIDKPNIRWTLHVGYPASLEGFVQEAGRAGRDGGPARCVVVVNPPDAADAETLLSLQIERPDRADAYQRLGRGADSDLKRQYYFLTNNYQGVESELPVVLAVLEDLLGAGPGGKVSLSKDTLDGTDPKEKALYRLAMLGIVDDYTIDYGAKKFEVHLDNYDLDWIDAQLLAFLRRVEPGRLEIHRRSLAEAPTDLRARAGHHVEVLLETLYRVIEPARVRALAEMHNFATSGESDQGLRQRILAYLSEGPLAGILHDIVTTEGIDAARITSLLDTVPAADPREWVGASARQLESYPDHPALLLVRALGEALLPAPDLAVMQTSVEAAFDSLADYGASPSDAELLLRWSLAQLRNQQNGRAWPLTPMLLDAWATSGGDKGILIDLEDEVFDRAEAGEFNLDELTHVFARRMVHVTAAVSGFTHKRTRSLR